MSSGVKVSEVGRTAADTGYLARLRRVRSVRAALLILFDVLGLVLSFLLGGGAVFLFSGTAAVENYFDLFGLPALRQAVWIAAFGSALVLWFSSNGHYTLRFSFFTELRHLITGSFFAVLADGFVQYALKEPFSRIWLVSTWVFAVPSIALLRVGGRLALDLLGIWRMPVLVVVPESRRQATVALLQAHQGLGLLVKGIRPLDDLAASWPGSWEEVCRRAGVECVVLAADEADLRGHEAVLSQLALENVPFIRIQSLSGLPVIAMEAHHLVGHDVLLLSSRTFLIRPLGRLAKALFDYCGAVLLLVLALPVFLVAAPLIASDGGPVFFAHRRVGRHGRAFDCLKFRTMVPDADGILAAVIAADPARRAEWEGARKLRDDPRITRIGKVLRAFSIDELPQILNVLKGQMSLVGPRPVSEEEMRNYGDWLPFYREHKPGMTGLWQVSGRSTLDFTRRIQLDSWYVKNWSLWLDIIILLKTVPAVLGRRGAY